MNRFIYYFLKSIYYTIAQLYYAKITVLHAEKIPTKKPLLLAINHSNAFWDGVMIGMLVNRPVWFLARGDVFKKPMVAKILNAIGIAPIYRMQEGIANLGKNKEVFDKCHQILENKQCIAIFPEGNCERESRLRDLKKGTARIAHGALATFKSDAELFVTCAGLNYDDPDNLNSEVLINFNAPLKVNDYFDAGKALDSKAAMRFTADIEKSLNKVMFHIAKAHDDDFFHFVKRNFSHLITGKSKNESTKFDKIKAFSEKVNTAQEILAGCKPPVHSYSKLLAKYQLREKYIAQSQRTGQFIGHLFIFLLLLIPSLPGLLFNSWPYFVAYQTAKKTVKKQEFFTSINLGMAGVLYLLWYLILLIVCTMAISFLKALMLIVALHFSGAIALHLASYFRTLRGHVRIFNLKKSVKEEILKQRTLCIEAIQKFVAA